MTDEVGVTRSVELDVESVLSAYSAEPEFDVLLPLGEVWRFRSHRVYGSLRQFRDRMMSWIETIPLAGTDGATGHPWSPHLPETVQDLMAVFAIAHLSVEPKITYLDALKLLRVPFLVQHIMEQIDRGSKTMESLWLARLVDEAKKKSEATDGTDPG